MIHLFRKKYQVWASVLWLDHRGVTKQKDFQFINKDGNSTTLRTNIIIDGKTVNVDIRVKVK